MKNVTKAVVVAFIAGKGRTIANTSTDGTTLTLHGNVIARKGPDGSIVATLAGWGTATTRERLNGLCVQLGLGQLFSQRKHVQMFRDAPVDPTAWVTLVEAPTPRKLTTAPEAAAAT